MEKSAELRRSVGGRGLQGSGPRSRTLGRGRLCTEPGCGTRLSIYNDGYYCSQHQAKAPPKTRGRKAVPAIGSMEHS
jgi:hypothetical protein